MKAFNQFALLLIIVLAANFSVSLLPFSFPGSVFGMLLLLLLLTLKVIKPTQIDVASGFLLDNMAFFFIPAGVGLISSLTVLKEYGILFLIITLITTFLVMGITAFIVDKLIKSEKENEHLD
jgi:holin-like protein